MVNVKKLLTKIMDNMIPQSNLFMNISTDAGGGYVLDDNWNMRKCGNIITITLSMHRTSSTAVGSNIYAGTLGGTMGAQYRPKYIVNGCGYSGSTCGVVQFDANGRFIVRCTGAALPANQVIYVSVTYII